MTKEELDIIKQLSILGKRIKNLPEIYEDPEAELSSQVFLHINALERIVFAREGLRAYTKVAAGELFAKLEASLKYKPRNAPTPVLSIPKKKQTTKKKVKHSYAFRSKQAKKAITAKRDLQSPVGPKRAAGRPPGSKNKPRGYKRGPLFTVKK